MSDPQNIFQQFTFDVESSVSEPDGWPVVSFEPSKYFGIVDRSEKAGLGLASLFCEGDFKPRPIILWAARLIIFRENTIESGRYIKTVWRPDRIYKTHSFLQRQIEVTAKSSMIDDRTFSIDYILNTRGGQLDDVTFGIWTESIHDERFRTVVNFEPKTKTILIQDGSTERWIGFYVIDDDKEWGFYETPETTKKDFMEGKLNRLQQLESHRIIVCQRVWKGNGITNAPVRLLIVVGEGREEVQNRLSQWYHLFSEDAENHKRRSHGSIETIGWHDFLHQQHIKSTNCQLQQAHLYGLYISRANAVEAIASNAPGITRPALLPSKIYYYGLWLWDTFFLGLPLLTTSDYSLAEGSLLTLLDNQYDNGLIPIATFPKRLEPHQTPLTQAPVLAMFGWAIYRVKLFREGEDRAVNFLKMIYSNLKRFHSFWYRERDKDGDRMCEYIHGWESGVDNSPYWDTRGAEAVEDLLLALLLFLDCKYLASMARVLDNTTEVNSYVDEAKRIESTILTEMYDESTGLFFSRYFDTHELIRIKTFESLLPLLLDDISADQRCSIMEHLTNPKEFWTAYPVPTVALDEPSFGTKFSGAWWRKPVWMSANWLILKGLMKWGYYCEAKHIIDRTVRMVLSSIQDEFASRRFGENYDPQTGEMTEGQASFFGWNGLVSSMITEFLGGIDFYHPDGYPVIDPICNERMDIRVFDCFVSTEKERYTFGFDRSRVLIVDQGVKCEIMEISDKKMIIKVNAHDGQPRAMTAYGEYFRSYIQVRLEKKGIGAGREVSWIQSHFPAIVELLSIE